MPVQPTGWLTVVHRLRPCVVQAGRLLWASPNSVMGLLLALAFLAGGARLPFVAITFGHVVLGTSPEDLDRLRAHEHTHVRECERWGPLFLLAYLLAGAWQWLRGRSAYWNNPFEVPARRAGGC